MQRADHTFGPVAASRPLLHGHGVAVGDPDGDRDADIYVVEGCVGREDQDDWLLVNDGSGFWHQQVQPRLQLSATSRKAGKGRVVTFRVADAGDPVAAATVRAGGRTPRTSAKGTATLRQARSVRVQATASKTGFASSAAITVPSRTSLRSQVRAALVRSRPRP